MASFVTPADRNAFAYHGVGRIFEYTNDDGGCVRTNCGQAAAATLLTFHGKLPPAEDQARRIMAEIERHHPPDNLGGIFGTSRRRVERICRSFGLRLRPIAGEAALKTHLDYGNAVIVMLGVSGGQFLGYELPAGHWMVAYGYDAEHVYITNWYQRMNWEEFHRGWDAFVPRLINMRQHGLVALPASL
jgi:hypothetical protein